MQASASRLRLATLGAMAAIFLAAGHRSAQAQLGDTIPSQQYYNGIEELYEGDFRDAQRTFSRSLTGSVKTIGPTGTVRWVDAICYHAMLGETFYHWGQPEQALQQFDQACTILMQYPKWMLRVQFPPQLAGDASLARVAIPWGTSDRRFVPAGSARRCRCRRQHRRQPAGAAGRGRHAAAALGRSTWWKSSAAAHWPSAAAMRFLVRWVLTIPSRARSPRRWRAAVRRPITGRERGRRAAWARARRHRR